MINKKNKLRSWISFHKLQGKIYLKTSDINLWGMNNFCTSAMRYSRELAKEGIIERVSKEEALLNGFNTSEGVWKINEEVKVG